MTYLRELLDTIDGSGNKPEVLKGVLKEIKNEKWLPNPGPQTDGYYCLADELFYGGSAGGGKSDLVAGLCINEHERCLVLRRYNEDARDLADRVIDVIGDKTGYNGQLLRYKTPTKLIEFAGVKDEKDKQRFKGRAHDLKCFDEVGDFLESQYRFIIAWNRSATPTQRCRVIATGNPPTTPEGLWVIQYWGAWLDPQHPNPAEEGELRWYTQGEDGKDIEVDGVGPHIINDEEVLARSRTFIRARLEDNPDLTVTSDYAATLASLPKELRDAYRDGKFQASLKDNPFQVIPTEWVMQAQERWTSRPPNQVPMCAIGVDVAQGGDDNNVIAPRYDGWFSEPIIIKGKDTPLGTDCAGKIIPLRKDNALVVIDCGGGYGGSVFKTLKENGIHAKAFKGAEASNRRTNEGQIKFYNKRSETYWRFREALDPAQEWGSPIFLPQDPELLADLCAATYEVTRQGIKIEPKKDIIKRIGRSPDKGDAITMCWSEGQKAVAFSYDRGSKLEMGLKPRNAAPQAVLGHQGARKQKGKR